MNILNIYIVDDSRASAERIKDGLNGFSKINVLDCSSVEEFPDKARKFRPHVVLTNINITDAKGRMFIKNLIRNRIPVVAIVKHQDDIVQGVKLGINEFVVNNHIMISRGVLDTIKEKVVDVYERVSHLDAGGRLNANATLNNLKGVIAIGASTGGTDATISILRKLPKMIPGIVVTQHMLDKFMAGYIQYADKVCSLHIKQAENGDLITPGTVLVAPGDRHMTVVKKGTDYIVKCFKGNRVSGHCPSVDVLFDSVADACGSDAVGIILTGMGEDGARGLKKMREHGAFTIGQSEEGCCVYGMPRKAYEIGAVCAQRDLNAIPVVLMTHLRKR